MIVGWRVEIGCKIRIVGEMSHRVMVRQPESLWAPVVANHGNEDQPHREEGPVGEMAGGAAMRSGDHVVSAEKDGIGLKGIGRGLSRLSC